MTIRGALREAFPGGRNSHEIAFHASAARCLPECRTLPAARREPAAACPRPTAGAATGLLLPSGPGSTDAGPPKVRHTPPPESHSNGRCRALAVNEVFASYAAGERARLPAAPIPPPPGRP